MDSVCISGLDDGKRAREYLDSGPRWKDQHAALLKRYVEGTQAFRIEPAHTWDEHTWPIAGDSTFRELGFLAYSRVHVTAIFESMAKTVRRCGALFLYIQNSTLPMPGFGLFRPLCGSEVALTVRHLVLRDTGAGPWVWEYIRDALATFPNLAVLEVRIPRNATNHKTDPVAALIPLTDAFRAHTALRGLRICGWPSQRAGAAARDIDPHFLPELAAHVTESKTLWAVDVTIPNSGVSASDWLAHWPSILDLSLQKNGACPIYSARLRSTSLRANTTSIRAALDALGRRAPVLADPTCLTSCVYHPLVKSRAPRTAADMLAMATAVAYRALAEIPAIVVQEDAIRCARLDRAPYALALMAKLPADMASRVQAVLDTVAIERMANKVASEEDEVDGATADIIQGDARRAGPVLPRAPADRTLTLVGCDGTEFVVGADEASRARTLANLIEHGDAEDRVIPVGHPAGTAAALRAVLAIEAWRAACPKGTTNNDAHAQLAALALYLDAPASTKLLRERVVHDVAYDQVRKRRAVADGEAED